MDIGLGDEVHHFHEGTQAPSHHYWSVRGDLLGMGSSGEFRMAVQKLKPRTTLILVHSSSGWQITLVNILSHTGPTRLVQRSFKIYGINPRIIQE